MRKKSNFFPDPKKKIKTMDDYVLYMCVVTIDVNHCGKFIIQNSCWGLDNLVISLGTCGDEITRLTLLTFL